MVCHGIPSQNKILKDGDIINIDVAIIKDGYFGDTSRMYYVGNVNPHAKKLVETTYEAMVAGIHAVKPGRLLGILVTLFNRSLIAKDIALFVNIAGMVLVKFIMNNLIFCIMDNAAKVLFLKRDGLYN